MTTNSEEIKNVLSEQEVIEFEEMCEELEKVYAKVDLLTESFDKIPEEMWDF